MRNARGLTEFEKNLRDEIYERDQHIGNDVKYAIDNGEDYTVPKNAPDWQKKAIENYATAHREKEEIINNLQKSALLKNNTSNSTQNKSVSYAPYRTNNRLDKYLNTINEEKELKTPTYQSLKKDNFGDWLGKQAWAGLSNFNKNLFSTLDFLLPTEFLGKYDVVSKLNNYYSSENKKFLDEAQTSSKERGKGWGIAGDVAIASVAALPDAVLAFMSGGTSSASSALSAVGSSSVVKQALTTMMKNPIYWTSMAQTLGSDFEEAKERGANDFIASTTAILTSALNAGIEIGGGIEQLPSNLKTTFQSAKEKGGTKVFKDAVLDWVKSALDEGKEEVLQSITSNAMAKLMYNHNAPIISTSDDTAVVNPKNLLKDFGMGATVGGILGGGQLAVASTVNSVIDKNYTAKIGKFYKNSNAVQPLIDAGLKSPKDSSAYRLANKYNNTDIKKMSNIDIGNLYNAIESVIQNEYTSKNDVSTTPTNKTTVLKPEKSNLSNSVSVGDVFKDTKTGNTVTVLERDTERTTIEIDTGSKKETRIFTNNQADNLAVQNQFEPIKTDSVSAKNITLTRIGDFYEAFGDEATELAEKLNLTPTYKTVNGVKTAMVGFPVHVLERYQNDLGNGYNLIISDNADTNTVFTNDTAVQSQNSEKTVAPKVETVQSSDDISEYENENADAQKMYKAMEDLGLTYDEQRAILNYKSSESYLLNVDLRRGNELSKTQEKFLTDLESAMDKFPQYKGVVYRNIGFQTRKKFDAFIDDHINKTKITYPAFTSASKSIDGYVIKAPYTVHYEIESLNGRDIANIGIEEEKEILFKTNTTFEFSIIQQTDNHIFLKMKEVTENGKSKPYGVLEDRGERPTVGRNASKIENSRELERIHTGADTFRGRSSIYDEVHNGTPNSNGGRIERGNQSQNLGSDTENGNDSRREGLLYRINSNNITNENQNSTEFKDKEIEKNFKQPENDKIAAVTTENDPDVIDHTKGVEGLKLIDTEKSTLLDGKTLVTGVFELNSDKDFNRKSYKKEKFDIFTVQSPYVKSVDGITYGHYGITGNKINGYIVTYLPVGLGVAKSDTQTKAKAMLEALENALPELPLTIKAYLDKYRCFGIDEDIKEKVKSIVTTVTEQADKVTLPLKNKKELISYLKNHKGGRIGVTYNNGTEEVRTVVSASDTAIVTEQADGQRGNLRAKANELSYTDDGFVYTSGNGVTIAYRFIDENSDTINTKSEESAENVHNGVLDREIENDNGIREPELVSETKEERDTGQKSGELGEDVVDANRTNVQAFETATSSERQLGGGNSDNGIRKSDDSDGNSGKRVDGNDIVDDELTDDSKNNNRKSKDYVISKTTANDLDNGTPNISDNIAAIEYIDASTGELKQIKGKSLKTAKDYLEIKNAYENLINSTLNEQEISVIEDKRNKLNKVYDDFVKKHGTIEKNKKILSADNDFYKISGLEIYDTKSKKTVKSEMFSKDTLSRKIPQKANNALDALSISISETGGVNLKRISELVGMSEDEAIKQLSDRIIYTPEGVYELNEVYLSGNVRDKYKAVKGKVGFEKNERMLRAVIPEDIPAKNITPQFGSPWIKPEYVADFLKETFGLYQTPTVIYDKVTGSWSISGNTWGDRTLMTSKYGTKYIDALKIAEKALNMRRIVVSKDKKTLVGETRAAQQKAEDIKAAFEEWCFKDSARRNDLVKTFNEKFNSNRNMDFSELAKYLTFDGLTDTFKLRDYQKRAVARAVFNGNTLLAHGVGTGKTAEMISIAMELKRMGVAKKNMMVVPPHKVADFRNDILKMYPSAKVAMLEKGANAVQRQKFYSLVASNDFDIVIIPHSSFGMLDVSADTKKAFINNQIAELEEVLTATQAEKGNIDGRFIKSLENQKKRLEEKLKFVTETAKDSGNTFEELGVDSLFVDEAHNFKNLPFYSKLSRVAGVSVNQSSNKTRASRAENMFMITDYLNRNNGRIVFGTATPITNSMSEIYNMLRFLRPDILEESGLKSFDAWASMFGSIVNQAEVDPTGRNMRMKERFSKFKNVSQMIEQFRRMADILRTGDVIDKLPEVERIDVVNETNKFQEEFLDVIDEIVDDIRTNGQRAEHNMLEITKAGQMAAVDLRFITSYFDGKYTENDLNLSNNRTTQVATKVYNEYINSNDRKGTQFVFCDVGVSENSSKKYNFYVYGDLINKLVALGIPRNEIAIAQEFEDKSDLSAKVNTGEIRVLIGSTAVMGEGMNAQNKAVALHHVTVPDRPSDIEQREGRIIRYGNENKKVRIYRYIQEKSYDSYQWQMQERKANFINQALSGGTVEELEEMSDFQSSAREAKAIASGNPLLLEKIEIEDKLSNLKSLKNKFNTEKLEMQDRLAALPNIIETKEKNISNTEADLKTVADNTSKEFEITFVNFKYNDRTKAAEMLQKGLKKVPRNGSQFKIGSYRGLELYYSSSFDKGSYFTLKGKGEYSTLSGNSAKGNITRIMNLADKIGENLKTDKALVKSWKDEIKTLKKEITVEFSKAKELEKLQSRLNDIDTKLGINLSDVDMSEVIVDDETGDEQYSLSEEDFFEAKFEDIETLSNQIDKWLKGEMQQNEQFQLGQTPNVLKSLGANDLPIVMTQSVMTKITGGKHNISIDELKKMPIAIADPIMIFKSATTPSAFVILTEMTDKSGDSVVAALHLNRFQDRLNVNRITSVYGKENIGNFVEKQAEIGNLLYIAKNKSRQWSTSRGLQLPKLVQSITDNNSILQKEDIVNSYNTKKSRNYSIESEDFTNEQSGSSILFGNGERGYNESSREQAGKISSFKRETKGKSQAERKAFARELFAKKQTEEKIDGTHKYNLIKTEAYNDDMLSIVKEAENHGKEVGFFVGNAIRKFDGKRNFKIDGIKISDTKILVRYDGKYSPQSLLKHEIIHTEWDNPEIQRARDIILSDLSESDKKEILQNGRYKEYMELYNGDEDAVWEEFIADTFADMNSYTDDYVDIAVDYWYNDKVVYRYNPSEYSRSIDAGGNEYSLSDNGFDIPYNEKRQLDDYVLHKNFSDKKLRKIDCKEIGDNFYVWENESKTDYTVVDMIEIDGNEDLINNLRKVINNGTHGFTKQLGSVYAGRSGNGRGSYNMLNAVHKRRKSANENGGISSEQSGSDKVGYSGKSGGNKETKYALTPEELDNLENIDLIKRWENAIEDYGTIPKGEIPARDIDIPKKISDKKYVSRFARTLLEAGVIPQYAVSEFEQAILDGGMTHEVITDKKARNKAEKHIKRDGFNETLRDWESFSKEGVVSKEHFALGITLYNQCITNKDTYNAMKLAAELSAEATRAGQTLQAVRMIKRMTPDGQLYYLEKSIEKICEEFRKKLGDKFKGITLNEELLRAFLEEADEKARNAIYDELCQSIADQIPATTLDKWNAWRYLAMLGNPRTHIRNIVGNGAFWVANGLKNYVGAACETVVGIKTEDRTRSFKKSNEAVEFAKKDFLEIQKELQGENAKYAVTNDIESKRTIFKTKFLEKLRTKNFDFLEAEDMWFLKAHYVSALARLATVRKIDLNSVSAETLNTLRAFAIKEAQAATYRDANALAEGLNRVQRSLERSDNRFVRATSFMVEGVMPFKKTPMNIAKQGVNYSPFGILKAIYKCLDKLKNGNATTTEIIDDLAKGLTGTGIIMLGYWLASMGILKGDEDKSAKEKQFDKTVGEQSYAIEIDGSSYTLDWLSPLNLSLFVGTKLYNLTKDGFSFADVTGALSSVSEPLLELSVFSGVNNLIESARYSDSEAAYAIVSDMATSYLLQAMPTVGGQLSRIIDNNKREYYYVDKNSNVPKGLQILFGRVASKVPILSYLFQPSVDNWGREAKYGNTVERILENSISPGYYSNNNYTKVDEEIKALYERTGDSSVLPRVQSKTVTEKGKTYNMTAAQYTEAKKIKGQLSYQLLNKLVKNPRFNQMTDEQKIMVIKMVYDRAEKETKNRMLKKLYDVE